MLLEYYQNFLL